PHTETKRHVTQPGYSPPDPEPALRSVKVPKEARRTRQKGEPARSVLTPSAHKDRFVSRSSAASLLSSSMCYY
ncbi:Phage-like element PBSX protein XkdO, partial [Clarias magur]